MKIKTKVSANMHGHIRKCANKLPVQVLMRLIHICNNLLRDSKIIYFSHCIATYSYLYCD